MEERIKVHKAGIRIIDLEILNQDVADFLREVVESEREQVIPGYGILATKASKGGYRQAGVAGQGHKKPVALLTVDQLKEKALNR